MSSKEIKVPQLAESITEGTIVKWLIAEGDEVQKDTPIVELETDKVNVEINTDYSGVLEEIVAGPGTDVQVGEVIARIAEGVSGKQKEESKPAVKDAMKSDERAESEKTEKPVQEDEHPEEIGTLEKSMKQEERHAATTVPATPSARRYAREHGIDLNNVDREFIEAYGRIGRREAELLGNGKNETAWQPELEQSDNLEAAEVEQDRPIERKRMSRRRMTIAKRLVDAQHEAAMLTTFNEIDMTEIMQIRKERKDRFIEKHGVKLGFMSFFTKAVVAALHDFPLLNAEIDGNELILKKFYDIGIAVSAEEGLVVPVVRNADQLDFAGIEKEIGELGKKARDNKLELADLQGGSFTITNGGVFGSLLSTPILNSPQVGILGMHTIQKRPIAMPADSIEVRPMMYVALSYDHRIVDGKEAVQFLVRIKELLEDPYEMLL